MRIVDVQAGRDTLARLFTGSGAEIGVERGVFSKMICRRNPGVRLICVDAWMAYRGYRDHISQAKLDGFYLETVVRLEPYNCKIVRDFSVNAAAGVADESLDFVYLDANHDKQHVLEDLEAWVPKVRRGGIVAGHDYIRRKGQDHLYGVKDAVNEYCERAGVPVLFIWREDKSPSWMYIKP